MKNQKVRLYFGLFAACCTVFLVFFFGWYPGGQEERVYHISVILNDRDDGNWKNVIMGMMQSAADYHVDLSIITLYDSNSTLQQLDLMKREIQGEADALIVVPSDCKAFSIGVKEMDLRIPLVILGPEPESERIGSYLSPDNREMGRALGRLIVKAGKQNRVVILSDSLRFNGLSERYEGLREELEISGAPYTLIECSRKEKARQWLEEKGKDKGECTAVVLNEELFLWIAQDISELKMTAQFFLYGIGGSSRSISYLENRIASGLVVPNQYDIGYYAVLKGIGAIKKESDSGEVNIDFASVTPDTIFQEENIRILFPN